MHRHASAVLFLTHLGIIVNSSNPSKMLIYRFVLIAAAILLHANHVLAVELVGEAQMRARDLLSPAIEGGVRIRLFS